MPSIEDYNQFDRGLETALQAGLRGTANARTSAISETHDTLKQANAIAARIIDMADRLCGQGGVDPSGEKQLPPAGELGRLRADMRDTRQAMVFADAALTRIEQELIG